MRGRLQTVFVFTVLWAVLIFTESSDAAVWETTANWTPRAEADYQAWVQANWDKNFFARPGFYKGLETDCADAVYAMRLIYAAQNGLPFAMKDPTGGSVLISNEMRRWDSLRSSDQRKRAFLEYVFELASTSSLPADSYPVAISRAHIGSGRFLLTDAKSHHSWTVRYLSAQGIPFLIFASRPAKVTFFERFEYPTMGFLFPRGLRPETHAGFRNFRQVDDIGKAVWDVPGYSLEQYQIPLKGWSRTMQQRLAQKKESIDQTLSRVLGNACRGVQERNELVLNADRLNRQLGRSCMNTQQYDDYSTPSRDIRLKGTFQEFQTTYQKLVQTGAKLPGVILAQVESVAKGDQNLGAKEYCTIQIAAGRTLSLGQVYARSLAGYLSSDPHDSVAARWGLEVSPGKKAQSCSSNRAL